MTMEKQPFEDVSPIKKSIAMLEGVAVSVRWRRPKNSDFRLKNPDFFQVFP